MDVAVALGPEPVEDGLLDEGVLVGGGHGETRTFPVRRSWERPVLTCFRCSECASWHHMT